MKQGLLWLSSLLFISCDNSDFKEPYQLGGLRILALHTDQPEISDGAVTLAITPIISNFQGSEDTVTIQLLGCEDPGLSQGADPSCDDSLSKTILSETTYNPSSSTTGGEYRTPLLTGVLPTQSIALDLDILSSKSAIEQANGVSYILQLKISVASESVEAIKRVLVSTRTSKNNNPSLTSVLLGGSAPNNKPTEESTLTIESSSPESYTVFNQLGDSCTFSEDLIASFYSTDGEFSESQITYDGELTWTPSSSTESASIVVILRDLRGGVDFQIVEF